MRNSKFLLILILGLLTALGPIATDIYLPAFREIANDFKVSIDEISYTISSFFFGLSVGQIVYGPLLERYGRKKPLYVGLVIYLIAAIGCATAGSLKVLIMFRFFQALGSCGGLVSARAIVRDMFDGKEVAKVFSMLMMVLAVSPILAPSIGGILINYYEWPLVFYIMAVIAVLLLFASVTVLPNTKSPNAEYSLRPKQIAKKYIEVFKDPLFSLYALVGAIANAGVYAYVSGSPVLYMDFFGISKSKYSIIFGVIASGLILSNQVNRLMLKWYSDVLLVKRAVLVQLLIAIVLVVFHFLELENVVLTTSLLLAYMSTLGFIFPNASALSMMSLQHLAGNASALLGFFQMVMGALAAALVSLIGLSGSLSMFVVMLLCPTVALLMLLVSKSEIRNEVLAAQ